MSSALQVNFRGLPPTEALVAIAAEQYREIKRLQPDLGECLIVIQSAPDQHRPLAHALVRLGSEGAADAQQVEARHIDPHVALQRALSAMRARLAAASGMPDPIWTPWRRPTPSRRPLPRAH